MVRDEMMEEHPRVKTVSKTRPTFKDLLTPEELEEFAPIPFAKLLCQCKRCPRCKEREKIDKEERAASDAREQAAKQQRRSRQA